MNRNEAIGSLLHVLSRLLNKESPVLALHSVRHDSNATVVAQLMYQQLAERGVDVQAIGFSPDNTPGQNLDNTTAGINDSTELRNIFGNKIDLKQNLSRLGSASSWVLVDTWGVSEKLNQSLSPAEVAACCSHTIAVVLGRKDNQTDVAGTVSILNESGANLIGSVINDELNPPLKDEIKRELNGRLKFIPARIRKALISKADSSHLLNISV